MAYLEPVVEDLFVESTAANPDIHKKRRRQNNIAETVRFGLSELFLKNN